ncbi:MAG: GH92 family glycosyl hydrolase, partial [Acidimicrobiales bacterium]
FSDTGTNWGSPGNLATFQVDSWSDSTITFTVPNPSGTGGQWHVTPGTPASVRVTTSTGSTSDAAVLEIAPSANQAAYYDNVGISPDTNQACANYDGDGYSYSAQALASAGLSPGAAVKADGATLTWPKVTPCSADNILAAGQTVLLPGESGPTKLVLLGSSSNGSSSGTVTIHYTDGSTSTGTVSFNDWAGGPSGADTAIATMPYRNTTGGRSQPITMYVYATSVPVSSAKTVASVTLPDVAGHVGSRTTAMHVFALGLGG